MNILVIEDEPVVQTLIKKVLEKHDCKPTLAQTVAEGQKAVGKDKYDALILDLGLPDGDGFELCKLLRNQGLITPILILSGENNTNVKIKCLNAGADDYLTKPFDAGELVARLNAVTRRSSPASKNGIIKGGELVVNKVKRTCTINDVDVKLTNNELDLLAYLMELDGTVASQYKIQEDLWDIDYYTPSNFINVYISYLRKKIGEHTDHQYIKTIRNQGFVFTPPSD